MGMYISNGNLHIGFEIIPSIRKKPCIVVKEGNEIFTLGTFKNKDDAVFFVDKLAELTNAKEIESNDD